MTRRGTTISTGNLGSGVLILVKNGLSYTLLSTQSLSSLDPSFDCLAITVKIKGASPIHLFNVYVPPIRSSSSDSRPKSFSLFLLPSSNTTYIFGDFNGHHSSRTPTHRKTNQAKICSTGSSLLIFYLLTTPNITPYYTVPQETADLVPTQIASKCTWQTVPDLSSDHLPISITIPTSPLINSIHRLPSFNYNKARWDDYLTYIDTHCPPPSNFITFSLSEATHTFTKLLIDAATSAIPLGSINRPAKFWWSPEVADAVAKLRKAFAKAHCSQEDRQNYISISRYTSTVISKAKLSHGRTLALAFLLKPFPVKSFLYFALSLAPPPQLHPTFPISQVAISL